MRILNVHHRILKSDINTISAIIETLSSNDDKVIAHEYWPRMKLDKGLQLESCGGHGPIGYYISDLQPAKSITFTFTKPLGFEGHHAFEMIALNEKETQLTHTISMHTTSFAATLQWVLAIRWLHDAFIEDAFDKVESSVSGKKRVPQWSVWVRALRYIMT